MAFDEEVKRSLDAALMGWRHASSRRMFGGVAYLVQGRMYAVLMSGAVGLKLPEEQLARARVLDWVSPFNSPSGGSYGQWIQFAVGSSEEVPAVIPWLRASYDYVAAMPAPRRRGHQASR